jgi:glycosyltransferase involved in cell wall biosynthesis
LKFLEIRKKKTLHIITKPSYDGVTTYATRLINHLPNYDHQIISCYNGSACEEIKEMNIPIFTLVNAISISSKYLLLKYIRMISFVRKNRYDIIHYHQGGVGILLLAVIFRKKAKVIHHLHSGNLIGDNRRQNISFLHLIILKHLSKKICQIAVADHVHAEYEKKVKQTTNIKIIQNSIPLLFQPKISKMNAVGYIGRFVYEKGFTQFQSVTKNIRNQLPQLEIFAMGENPNSTSDIYYESMDQIRFLSPSFNIAKFYNNIDVLLFLSKAPESLPLVVLEAISFDVCVIAYRINGVREILGENYPFYVNNEQEVISKISKYYSPGFDFTALSKIHKNRSEKFNFTNMINCIDNLYQNLIV